MAEKFLTKDGLDRFFNKVKSKFAPIDNPNFMGKVTVETPKFEKYSKGREVVNREYASRIYRTVVDDIEKNPSNAVLKIDIRPEDWKGQESPFYYTKIADRFYSLGSEDLYISCLTEILYNEIDMNAVEGIISRCFIQSGMDCRLYLIGEKPKVKIPVKVHLFISHNLEEMLMEGDE